MKAYGTARAGTSMEIKYTNDDKPIGQVSLAFKTGIKDKNGEYKTQWVSASMFGKRAESLAPYIVKGSLHAYHLRDLHIDEYTTKDGEKRVSLKAMIDDVELCGGKREEGKEPVREKKAKGNADQFEDDIPW